ncbi:MAG: hypothetical protein ABW007_20560 [Chitinophagaceae bacterium]
MAELSLKDDKTMQEIFSRQNNYWIILAVNDSLISPLSYASYNALHKELHIPDDLLLKQ